VEAATPLESIEFSPITTLPEERPRCLSCGCLIDAPPVAETVRRRGTFAVVVQWRTCGCGSFVRTQLVRRVDVRRPGG
jgi:hypothetical protein